MKTIKKLDKDTVLEEIKMSGTTAKMVTPFDTWIVINEDGSYYKDEFGYWMNRVKKIAQKYADSLN